MIKVKVKAEGDEIDLVKEEVLGNELNIGIKMGMDSISNVLESVKDDNFKKILLEQYNKYNEILNKVDKKLQTFDKVPKDLLFQQDDDRTYYTDRLCENGCESCAGGIQMKPCNQK